MEFKKTFGLERTWDYIKVNFFITYKRLIEYKQNAYLIIVEQIFYTLSAFIFLKVLFNNFQNIIVWNFSDFLLFFILLDVMQILTGVFLWKNFLREYLTQGMLNNYLFRPIKTYFSFFFSNLNSSGLVYILITIPMYSLIIFYLKINFYNIIYSSIIFILLIIMHVVNFEFIKSLDFIFIGLTNTLWRPYNQIIDAQRSYPAQFFRKGKMMFLFSFGLPYFFVGSLLVPIISNKEIYLELIQIIIILGVIIIESFLIFLIWKKGLKKYEAFG